ncbi:hypothetical protein CASFOL_034860 [Castilleja foliolosa]|uniref:C2H2-type domain-containing protein n=1 Tax=Castilleja foliolosa TaxID=1961234 RepID=A0ABD3BR21_9LAMI
MNSQDNKTAAISTGHEVHLCRRCGWPFPNPHPSAKHRRAHKKLCGTIEGYTIILSEEHVSYNDHASDEDEHTPNPKVANKTAEGFGSSGGVGARSNKSEDDVFSDAVTEFSDSGISPRLEERFESVRELDTILEQKRLEAHLNGNETINVDTTADATEQVNDQTKSAEGPSVGLITGLQPDLVESEILMDNKSEYGKGESQQGQTTDESAPMTLELDGVRISDQTVKKEDLCDKLVSDQSEKALQNSDPSAEISGPVKTVCEIANSEKSRDNSDSYVAVNTSPEESLLSTPSIKSDGLTEQSEAKSLVSSIEIKLNENQNLEESKDRYSVDKVLIQPEFSVDKESNNVNQSDEKSGYAISGTRTEKVEGAPVGPTMPSNDSTDLLSLREAADLVEPSKTESSPLEPRDNGTNKKTFERLDTVYFDMGDISDLEDYVATVSSEGTTEQQKSEEPVYAAQVCAELNNHNGDKVKSEKTNPSGQEEALPVKDDLKETSPDVEDGAPPLDVPKKSNEVYSANNVNNVDDDVIIVSKSLQAEVDEKLDSQEVGVAAVDLSANNSSSRADISELEDDVKAVSSEGTTEQEKSEEPVYGAQVCAELNSHNGDEEKSKSNPSGPEEALPVKKEDSNETSPDVEDVVSPLDVRKDSNEACASNSVVNAAQVCAELNNHNGDEEKSKSNPGGQEEALPAKKEGSNETSPDLEDVLPPLDVRKDSNEVFASNSVVNVDDYVIVDSKSLQAEVDKKLVSQEVGVAVVDLSANNSSSGADISELEVDVEAVSSEGTTEQQKSEEPVYAARVCAELNNHNGDEERSEKSPSGQEEALPVKKEGLTETSPDVEDVVPSLDVRKDSDEVCAANSIVNVDDYVIIDSKSSKAEVDEKLDSQEVGVAAVDLSANSSSSRADSLEANCGSVSDTLETDSQKSKTTTVEAQAPPDKSDTFEAPSFMTLVQSGGKDNNDRDSAVSEIETGENNQQLPKSDALEAGWFPSITNVLNESEGRKKNEEIIAKVTKWSSVKQHGPLKNLLNEVKSLDTEKVKDHETDDSKDNGAAADVAITDATAVVVGPTDQKDAQAKDVEQWNSPARYPIEIKKETKKKGRSLWVPFVCCSSVHRDL